MGRVESVIVQDLRPTDAAHGSPRAQPEAHAARATSKTGSVSGGGGSSKIEDQQRSDPSTQKCHLASSSVCVCV